jgi:hypothetical protein
MSSAAKTPAYVRHVFRHTKELQTYSVYSIVEVRGKENLLTDALRIEKFNNKSNASNIDYYLRLRTTTSWDKSEKVTGLRPTKKGLFYGDRLNKTTQKRTLLVFKFSNDSQTLFIDVYRDFYPYSSQLLQNIINAY